ncbi:MAG: hypothetical protein QOH49_1063 [Acidobacteriota bacterium]|jgi:hypothetical protein|nr:hypothetical protein [Acidobacteriota bacterium]
MRQAIFKTLVLVTTTFILVVAAHAQGQQTVTGRLRLESLERLAPKAAETVNIEIDGILIKFAGSILSDKDADERAVKELVTGLRGVYVRSYEFKSDGQFADADVAAVREQLRAPGWSRVMDVKSRGLDFGDAEVYMATAGGHVEGFALLVVEPKELTVVNIVGSLDLDKLRQLGDTLNLPHIHVKRKKSGGN